MHVPIRRKINGAVGEWAAIKEYRLPERSTVQSSGRR
jgi:hypothetical protein